MDLTIVSGNLRSYCKQCIKNKEEGGGGRVGGGWRKRKQKVGYNRMLGKKAREYEFMKKILENKDIIGKIRQIINQ